MSKPANPDSALIADLRKLAHGIIKDAGRRVKDETSKKMVHTHSVLDRCRAVDAVLKLLQKIPDIDPDSEASEYERALNAFHGKGEGDAAPSTQRVNGHADAASE
jgi:hypothetical protein